MTLQEYIQLIWKEFSKHNNRHIANKVLKCLGYIEQNLDKIYKVVNGELSFAAANGNADQHCLYDDSGTGMDKGMAFHLNRYFVVPENYPSRKAAAEAARKDFDAMVQKTVAGLDFINKHKNRNLYFDSFLSKILDSQEGCMDARLNGAFAFLARIQTGEVPSIDVLYKVNGIHELALKINKNATTKVANTLKFLQSFEPYWGESLATDNRTPKTIEVNSINLIRDYKAFIELDLFLSPEGMIAHLMQTNPPTYSGGMSRFHFADEEIANTWLRLIQDRLVQQDQYITKAIVGRRHGGISFGVTRHQMALLEQIKKEYEAERKAAAASLPRAAIPSQPIAVPPPQGSKAATVPPSSSIAVSAPSSPSNSLSSSPSASSLVSPQHSPSNSLGSSPSAGSLSSPQHSPSNSLSSLPSVSRSASSQPIIAAPVFVPPEPEPVLSSHRASKQAIVFPPAAAKEQEPDLQQQKFAFLTALKQEVTRAVWNSRGKGFFGRKTPEGIQILRDLLRALPENTVDNQQALQQIFSDVETLLKQKQIPYRGWGDRAQETMELYVNRYAELQAIEGQQNNVR